MGGGALLCALFDFCHGLKGVVKEPLSPRRLCGHLRISDYLKIKFGLSGKYSSVL